MDDQTLKFSLSPLFIAAMGMMSVTIVLIAYYCVSVGWNDRRLPLISLRHGQLFPPHNQGPTGLDNSFIQLIPAHTVTKEEASVAGDDNTCAVCLGEFKEGEEVRRLPECLHLFHVLCIDRWLHSHSSCPLCRTDMTPPPAPLPQGIPADS
ncbi:RING-H2 finger protein ATL52-like protein [Cinnamomum micranthum f. kanehirae]|uniref:RING-type E3 ubiquitin transferase n=1 Tax=Cinnamomum micranthum f. kanehirae TaxID=337451 RepID=A0A443PXH7_9MAGN|nr:RING-H2 finger protein ATL52-like protein [Cinnamomum micranthum f. kanehirae]